VIIVDSSDDGKIGELASCYHSEKIKFVCSGVRVMPAAGRNIGARKAKGNVLIFLDADVIPHQNFINNVAAAYMKGYKAGCGSITLPEFQKENAVAVAQYYLQLSEYIPVGPERVKNFPVGCVVFCEKNVFVRAGGFPEIRAAEDVLFGHRINKITPLWFIPDICVAHIFREDVKGFLSNQKLLGKYAAIYRKKESKSIFLAGFLSKILFPVFYFYKCCLVANRVMHAGPVHILKLLKASRYFFLGIWHWTAGFEEGTGKLRVREFPPPSRVRKGRGMFFFFTNK
jgi:glycosyltransferase involved in cell wall biosynthesis